MLACTVSLVYQPHNDYLGQAIFYFLGIQERNNITDAGLKASLTAIITYYENFFVSNFSVTQGVDTLSVPSFSSVSEADQYFKDLNDWLASFHQILAAYVGIDATSRKTTLEATVSGTPTSISELSTSLSNLKTEMAKNGSDPFALSGTAVVKEISVP